MTDPDGGDCADVTPDSPAERAIALIRALATLAEGDSDYLSFARDALLSHEAVRRLADAVSPGGLRPLTRIGRVSFDRASLALEDVFDFSRPLRPALEAIASAGDGMTRLHERSRAVLATLDGPMPDVLDEDEISAFTSYQSQRLSVLCYYGALLYGSDAVVALRDVRLNEGDPERSHASLLAVLERFAGDLFRSARYGAWHIEPIVHASHTGCIPQLNGYVFRWSNNDEYRACLESGGYHEANPGLAVGLEDGRPSYRGLGFIVGPVPERAFSLRSTGVHTKLPVHAFGLQRLRLDQPLTLLAEVYGGDDAFCVDPQDFAAALDRNIRCTGANVR